VNQRATGIGAWCNHRRDREWTRADEMATQVWARTSPFSRSGWARRKQLGEAAGERRPTTYAVRIRSALNDRRNTGDQFSHAHRRPWPARHGLGGGASSCQPTKLSMASDQSCRAAGICGNERPATGLISDIPTKCGEQHERFSSHNG
jgi:hypothetical protein